MNEPIHWLDVNQIAEELYDTHPDTDPLSLTFPDLKHLVEQLPAFTPQPSHPANERILETIQMLWLEEYRDQT